MADDTPGTPTGQTTGSDADVQAQTTPTDTAAVSATQAGATSDMVAKADADRAAAAARKEADAKARAEKARADAAEAELQKYRDAEQARKDAELTEIEKAQKAAAEAAAAKDAAEARAAAAELAAERARIIAEDPDGAHLPKAYKAQVTGNTPDELTAALESVKAQFAADREAILAAAAGKPASIGTVSNPGGQPTATPSAGEWSPENNTVEAWRKERAKLGVGSHAF